MIRRLKKKFVLAGTLAVFLVLLFLISAVLTFNYLDLRREADETLRILADNGGRFPDEMRMDLAAPMDQPEPMEQPGPVPEEGREALPMDGRWGLPGSRRGGFGELAFQSRYFAARYDADGGLRELDLENVATLTESDAAALAEAVLAGGREKGFTGDYRYCRADSGGETLLLFLNCQRELASFRSSLIAAVGLSLLSLTAVAVLLALFSGRIVRPMAESYAKQKRFITDAGHELKTPITIIRADAEVLGAELEDEDNEWLTDIRRQTDRLTELTGELIYLSKMEEENPALAMQSVDLSELADETARSFQALALSRGKTFRAAVEENLRVNGDEKALAKLVSILLDNAMKYSPEGGAVELRLEKAGKNAVLTVKNTAEGMEKGNADRLFERFARFDSSRSSETGGFGLGLAIAKAVAETHKGRIHAVSEDGASLTVTAELPLETK